MQPNVYFRFGISGPVMYLANSLVYDLTCELLYQKRVTITFLCQCSQWSTLNDRDRHAHIETTEC